MSNISINRRRHRSNAVKLGFRSSLCPVALPAHLSTVPGTLPRLQSVCTSKSRAEPLAPQQEGLLCLPCHKPHSGFCFFLSLVYAQHSTTSFPLNWEIVVFVCRGGVYQSWIQWPRLFGRLWKTKTEQTNLWLIYRHHRFCPSPNPNLTLNSQPHPILSTCFLEVQVSFQLTVAHQPIFKISSYVRTILCESNVCHGALDRQPCRPPPGFRCSAAAGLEAQAIGK